MATVSTAAIIGRRRNCSDWVLLMLLLAVVNMQSLCLLSICVGARSGDDRLQVSVYTPPDDGYPEGTSWITLLATSLLPQGTPGYFWGAVTADAVQSACGMIEAGSLSIPATVSAYGATYDWNLQIQAIGGCDASADSPQGVEMVFIDDTGRTNAVMCDEHTWTIGCAIYNSGDDINVVYNQAPSVMATIGTSDGPSGRTMHAYPTKYSNRRNLLDDATECLSVTGVGTVGGAIATTLACLPSGLLSPFCVLAAVGTTIESALIVGCTAEAIKDCFKGSAMVITLNGDHKSMLETYVGDKVAVWNKNHNKLEFSDIYGFGHADANTTSNFLQVRLFQDEVSPGTKFAKIELTPFHFVLSISGLGISSVVHYKYAKDIILGDKMLAWDDITSQFIPYTVTDIVSTIEEGLYNPLTLQGTIIVDGVVASVHSEWFLDNIFDNFGITHFLPSTYQGILSIPRLLYRFLGKESYTSLYGFLDSIFSIPTFGMKYGGNIFFLLCIIATFGIFNLIVALHNSTIKTIKVE